MVDVKMVSDKVIVVVGFFRGCAETDLLFMEDMLHVRENWKEECLKSLTWKKNVC